MKGLGRNLRYWFVYCAKTIGLVWLMMVGIVAVTSFFDGDFQLETFCTNLAIYFGMSCILINFVYAFTNVTTIFPITISNGTRRGVSLLAMILVQHIMLAIGLVFSAGALLFTDSNLMGLLIELWPMSLAGFFIMMGLSSLIALLCGKFGRVLGIIIYILAVVACVVLFTLGFIVDYFDAFKLLTMPAMISILAGSVVFDVIIGLLLYASTRKSEIKFA